MTLSVVACAASLFFPAAASSAPGINDAQIASIVVIANQVDIDAGKVAHAISTNSEVTNAELTTLLVSVRPAIVAHLEHAKPTQSTLGR